VFQAVLSEKKKHEQENPSSKNRRKRGDSKKRKATWRKTRHEKGRGTIQPIISSWELDVGLCMKHVSGHCLIAFAYPPVVVQRLGSCSSGRVRGLFFDPRRHVRFRLKPIV
jgi:hypothetical protein